MSESIDYYKNHDLCCLMYIKSSAFYTNTGPLHELYSTAKFSGKNKAGRFIFDNKTGDLIHWGNTITEKDVPPHGIYIDDIIRSLYDLHLKTQEGKDINQDTLFIALAHYFNRYIHQLIGFYKIPIQRVCFIMLVPNAWSILETSIYDTIIIPLFVTAGLLSSDKERYRIMFVTELEGSMSSKQFRNTNTIPPYIERENRCILFNISVTPEKNFQCEVVYFQFKEDHRISLFNDRYFAPKIISTDHNSKVALLDLAQIKHELKTFIIQDVLDMGHLLTSEKISVTCQDRTRYTDICDYLIYQAIFATIDDRYCYYDNSIKKYFSKTQLDYMLSNEFLELVYFKTEKLISKQLEEIIQFIDILTKRIPFFRKSIALENNTSDFYSDSSVEYAISELINCILQENYFEKKKILLYLGQNNRELIFTGTLRLFLKKSLFSNRSLPPLIVAKSNIPNKLGLPIHFIMKKSIPHPTPKYIVHIDITSSNMVSVHCDLVNSEGLIKKTFKIDLSDTNLSSILLFFKSSQFKPSRPKRFLKRLKGHSKRPIETDISHIRTGIFLYLQQLLNQIRQRLGQVERVGYVLSLEKTMLDDLRLASRFDFLEWIGNRLVVRLVVREGGDDLVWRMLSRSSIDPLSYYLHAHLADDSVYLKLYQVVDLAVANGGSSQVFIKDRLIRSSNVYSQVAEAFWHHLRSLDHQEVEWFVGHGSKDGLFNLENFGLFMKAFVCFLKEELFNIEPTCYYSGTYTLYLNKHDHIRFSLPQLIEIAILPTLKNLMSVILSSIVNPDMFGKFEIAKVFLTGNVIRIKKFNSIYHRIITHQIEEELKEGLRKESYQTRFDVFVFTNQLQKDLLIRINDIRHFCFDIFQKGELRPVHSTSKFIKRSSSFKESDKEKYENHLVIKGAIQYGYSYALVIRGEPFDAKQRIKLETVHKEKKMKGFRIKISPFKEPSDLNDVQPYIDNSFFLGITQVATDVPTIHPYLYPTIEITHQHSGSFIQIAVEYYIYENGLLTWKKLYILHGERQTLKYF